MSKITAILTITISTAITACVSNDGNNIKPIESRLGNGWVCHAAPDVFKSAGVVLEQTDENILAFYDDYRDKSVSGTSALGAEFYSSNTSVGAVAKLLKAVDVLADASASVALGQSTTISVKYGNTEKSVLAGKNVEEIITSFKNRTLNQNSKYYVIRESISAKDISIVMDKDVVAQIAGAANVDNIVDLNAKINRDSQNNYVLNDSYPTPLGICTLTTKLRIEHGIDGSSKVSLGDNVSLGSDFDVIKN